MNQYLRKSIRVTGYAGAALLLFVILFELNPFHFFGYMPTPADIKTPRMSVASELYTTDSVLIGRYFKEKRSPVTLEEVDTNLIKILLATEDIRFYEHHGIDVRSVFAGVFSTASGDKRGASTITQQLVKNLYHTRHPKNQGVAGKIPLLRTISFKMKEWFCALKLEHFYTKAQLLEMYLNTVGFGNNAFGIKVAAKTYFNKLPSELNWQEGALLVGMLKATTTYNPFNNYDKALERRNVVLAQLVKYELLSSAEADSLMALPIIINQDASDNDEEQDSYIRVAAKQAIQKWCDENGYDVYADGLKIYTTIDSKLQTLAEQANAEKMREIQRRFNVHWRGQNPWTDENKREIKGFFESYLKKTPAYKSLKQQFKSDTLAIDSALHIKKTMQVFTWNGERDTTLSTIDSLRYYLTLMQSGMMTLDPFSGHIKVWIGGINHRYFKYDHVNQSKRQPGSTFKPFAYCAAIDNGMSPCDRFYDEPVHIRYEEKGKKKVWSPQNSDWVFTGYHMTLRWAMAKSCNSVTAQITEKVGWDKVARYAHKCGIRSPLAIVPSISLGSSGVTLQEMVNAYGTFLNKGLYTEPLLVHRICDKDGKLLAEFKATPRKVLSEETAWLMVWMFRGGMQEPGGTSQALWEYDLFKKGNEVGGKTGTSSNHSDGWYIGLTKDLVTGVWVGANDPSIHFRVSELGEGSKTALPIYGRFMELVYQHPETGISLGKFPEPIVKITKNYRCGNILPKADADSTLSTTNPDSILVTE